MPCECSKTVFQCIILVDLDFNLKKEETGRNSDKNRIKTQENGLKPNILLEMLQTAD